MALGGGTKPTGSQRTMGAWHAVGIGHLWITLPGVILFFGTFFLVSILMNVTGPQLVPAIAGLVVGWVWWGVMAPKWRQWALAHGAPYEKLKSLAIYTGLTWARERDNKPVRRQK